MTFPGKFRENYSHRIVCGGGIVVRRCGITNEKKAFLACFFGPFRLRFIGVLGVGLGLRPHLDPIYTKERFLAQNNEQHVPSQIMPGDRLIGFHQ